MHESVSECGGAAVQGRTSPVQRPRLNTRRAPPKKVDWFGAINRYTSGRKKAANQEPDAAENPPRRVAPAAETSACLTHSESVVPQLISAITNASQLCPVPTISKSDSRLSHTSKDAPRILVAPSSNKSLLTQAASDKNKPQVRGDPNKCRHLLVREYDNSSWYPSLVEKVHGTRKIALDKESVQRRPKIFNSYKWFVRGGNSLAQYNAVAALYSFRGRNGHAFQRKGDVESSIQSPSSPLMASPRPSPIVAEQATDHRLVMRTSISAPNLLVLPQAANSLDDCRVPSLEEVVRRPSLVDSGRRPLLSKSQSAKIDRKRRTVNFSHIVHLAHASSPREYERAGPDSYLEYTQMPVEERRRVNHELDSFRWNEMIKKVHPSSAGNMPRRRTLSVD